MTAAEAQVRIIMSVRNKRKTQEQAAAKAILKSRKTVQRYQGLGKLPRELKKPRSYRTRNDPFKEDWAEVEKMLKDASELDAKTLTDGLCQQQPGKYPEGQLRTFQRQASNRRVFNESQELTLEQVRQPGEMMPTDGTWMTALGVLK